MLRCQVNVLMLATYCLRTSKCKEDDKLPSLYVGIMALTILDLLLRGI